MHKTIIIGYLGGDPEVRYMENGNPVANFRVGVTERWKDKHSGEKREHTEWYRCAAWGKRGEVMAEYLRKGSRVYIEGKMRTRKWQDRDGNDRYSTDLQVDSFEFLGEPKGGSSGRRGQENGRESTRSGGRQEKPRQRPAGPPPESVDDFDDDIPF